MSTDPEMLDKAVRECMQRKRTTKSSIARKYGINYSALRSAFRTREAQCFKWHVNDRYGDWNSDKQFWWRRMVAGALTAAAGRMAINRVAWDGRYVMPWEREAMRFAINLAEPANGTIGGFEIGSLFLLFIAEAIRRGDLSAKWLNEYERDCQLSKAKAARSDLFLDDIWSVYNKHALALGHDGSFFVEEMNPGHKDRLYAALSRANVRT